MPKPIINGTVGKIRKSVRTSFDKTSGIRTTVEWESAGDNLNGYARALRDLGIQYDHSASGVRSSLVEMATGEVAGLEDIAIDRWEVVPNENMLDLKEHPYWATLETEQRAQVLKDVKKHEDGKVAAEAWADVGEWGAEDVATAGAFYALLIRGTTHYPVYNWVVRHTTNVSDEYAQNVADEGVLTVYTTAQLISEVSNSSYWLYPMPARLRSKISGISAPTAVTGLTWGWLKKPSSEVSGANNRIDIATEYILAQWPDIIY